MPGLRWIVVWEYPEGKVHAIEIEHTLSGWVIAAMTTPTPYDSDHSLLEWELYAKPHLVNHSTYTCQIMFGII